MSDIGPGPFRPTHDVPDAGLRTFGSPDPGAALSTPLDAGLGVRLLEQRPDGWAEIECSNGWRCWVDGRLLVARAAPPAPAATTWVGTHRVPASGLPAWDAPDPSLSPAAELDGGLDVQIAEGRPDGWTRILCANGWAAWVDGRRLESLTAAPAATASTAAPATERSTSMRARAWMPLVGGALVLISAFTPWYTAGPLDLDASKIPLWFLVAHSTSDTGPKANVALLIAALLILAAGALTYTAASRGLTRWMLLIGASMSTNLAVCGVGRWARPDTGLSLSIGIPLLAVGGILAALAHWMTRLSSKSAWAWLA